MLVSLGNLSRSGTYYKSLTTLELWRDVAGVTGAKSFSSITAPNDSI